MKWKKYTIHTTTEAEDIVSAMLMDLGVEGVQLEDNVPLSDADTKGMFIDILPALPPDDGTSRVSFFLREAEGEGAEGTGNETGNETGNRTGNETGNGDAKEGAKENAKEGAKEEAKTGADASGASCAAAERPDASTDDSYTIHDRIWSEAEIEALLKEVRTQLSDMRAYTDVGEGRIEIGETQDTDWQNNWKQFFKPFLIEDVLIKPTWEEIPKQYEEDVASGALKLLEMDPGTAFGTGTHETTQLCIRMLKKYLKGGERVLDLGTGSGILGIAALKRGAASVTATDLDDACEAAVAENLAANHIAEDKFRLLIGNVLGDEAFVQNIGTGVYDLMLANILAPVIVLLAAEGAADRFVKQGGIFITSGIIDTKEADVKAAFEKNPNWEILETDHQGEWVSVTAKRM